ARTAASAPQLVGDAVVRDLEQPWSHCPALRIERRRSLPDRDEDVLDDLLRGWPAERLRGHSKNGRRVARVERTDGVLPAGRQLGEQSLIRGVLVHRGGLHANAWSAGVPVRRPTSYPSTPTLNFI